jgi:hypothetical protein
MKDKRNLFYFCFFITAAFLLFNGCSNFDDYSDDESGNSGNTVTVSPSVAILAKGDTQQFSATVANSYSRSVTWSVEGNFSSDTTISWDGLLTVGRYESAGTLTVKATRSSYYDNETTSGTATVTVADEEDIPSNFKVSRPGKTAIDLSWSQVKNAAKYKIYRSMNDGNYSLLSDISTASYTDTSVSSGSSYYYKVAAVVNGREIESAVAFSFAAQHFRLPVSSSQDSYPINLPGYSKHYYRLAVSTGKDYTITWQNGNGQNAGSYVQCTAWENDGTEIFGNATYGSASPETFTAISDGFVTVEVANAGYTNCEYQIYYDQF